MSEKRKPDESFEDIFEEFVSSFGKKSGPSRRKPHPEFRHPVYLTPEDLAAGVTIELTFERLDFCESCDGSGAEPGSAEPTICPKCNGTGEMRSITNTFLGQMVRVIECTGCKGRGKRIQKPCAQCDGEGYQPKPSHVTLEIPAGTKSGTQFRISGQGDMLDGNGTRGNLIVVVTPTSASRSEPMTLGGFIKGLFRRK